MLNKAWNKYSLVCKAKPSESVKWGRR